jgi:ribosomal protein S18 acetylase RimI-like enzyme
VYSNLWNLGLLVVAFNVIRDAKVEDLTTIVDMMRAGSDEGIFHSQAVPLEELRKAFRKYAFEEKHRGYKALVCQVENTIAGYIDYEVKRGVGHILGIYVRQEYRRKNIGRQLMEKALDDFHRQGCHKTRLEVFAHNTGALEFYRCLGFTQEGFLHEDEEKEDAIILSKFLQKS